MTGIGTSTAAGMTTGIRFRLAGPDDVEAIVALVESGYRGDASRAGWTTEADLLDGRRTGPDEITALLDAADSVFVLGESVMGTAPPVDAPDGTASRPSAHDRQPLVACAHLRRNGDAAWFGMFAVRPGLQGAGIGRAMLADAERIAREQWACREMRMSVISVREELISWYQRRGYQRTGQYAPFPYGDARFGIPRRDDLRFEVLCKTLQAD